MKNMHRFSILSAVLIIASTPVIAQVTVDLHALQALPDQHTASRPSPTLPSPPPARASIATRTEPTGVAQRPAPSAQQPQGQPPPVQPPVVPQPAMPETVPDVATINPVTPPAPPAGAAPPLPPPVSEKATTTAAAMTTGLRLTFAPGESELSPDSNASIKQLTDAAPPGDATTFNVLAYAPGKPDDPSTARRISLSRAMAVRSALVADGVPSARIFVRALGEQHGDGPPDRVDIGVTGLSQQPDSASAK